MVVELVSPTFHALVPEDAIKLLMEALPREIASHLQECFQNDHHFDSGWSVDVCGDGLFSAICFDSVCNPSQSELQAASQH